MDIGRGSVPLELDHDDLPGLGQRRHQNAAFTRAWAPGNPSV